MHVITHLSNTSVSAALQAESESGLFSGVVETLPTDPVSIFVLVFLAAGVGLVLWAGRSKSGGGPA